MKKSFIYIMIIFVSIMFFTVNVNAYDCVYGVGQGDSWQKVITFRVNNYDDIQMNIDDVSFFLFDKDPYENTRFSLTDGPSYCDGCDYMDGHYNNGFTWNYYFYIALFANQADYDLHLQIKNNYCQDNQLAGDACDKYEYLSCPRFVQFGTDYTDSNRSEIVRHLFYTDALTDQGSAEDRWFNSVDVLTPIVLTLDQAKEEEAPEDLRTGRHCNTYNAYLTAMKQAAKNGTCNGNPTFQKYYDELMGVCENYRASSDYSENFEADEPKVIGCMTACSYLRDDVVEICGFDVEEEPGSGSCYSLGSGVLGWIMKILNMIRYILPVVMIILGILDFIKAIASDDEGEIKKAGSRFVKRLIAAALIFIVPLILQFILGMFNLPGLDPSNPFCID